MPDQIVEIASSGRYLNKARGFLEIHQKDGVKLGQVALDDILTVIISAPGCTLSTNIIDYFAQQNIPLVICGNNYLPNSIALPLQGQGRQFHIMRAQTALSEPRRKRAWQAIIRAKITNQATLLQRLDSNETRLFALVAKVKSGDPDNYEAQAARYYWKQLFGHDFKRDRTASGTNSALNYGYTILRSCIARGVSGAGLHPTFSIHHKNPQNPLNLVDDLIEPYRPIADYFIRLKNLDNNTDLTPELKAKLVSLCQVQIPLDQYSPLSMAAVKTCRSYASYCLGETNDLLLPALPEPLNMLSAL